MRPLCRPVCSILSSDAILACRLITHSIFFKRMSDKHNRTQETNQAFSHAFRVCGHYAILFVQFLPFNAILACRLITHPIFTTLSGALSRTLRAQISSRASGQYPLVRVDIYPIVRVDIFPLWSRDRSRIPRANKKKISKRDASLSMRNCFLASSESFVKVKCSKIS